MDKTRKISVEEGLPDPKERVLLWLVDTKTGAQLGAVPGCLTIEQNWESDDVVFNRRGTRVTHWSK